MLSEKIKQWETLPQSVFYSKKDPWFAFMNKEYALLAPLVVHIMQKEAEQTQETQESMRGGKWCVC